MSSSLNEVQVAFLFSMYSEFGAGLNGPFVGRGLRQVIELELKRSAKELGDWELAWGPAVFQLTPQGIPQNVLYAVRSADRSRAVIAIAGTNPNSMFDWNAEDWDIGAAVPWSHGNPPRGAAISRGSATALEILGNIVPAVGVPGTGTNVRTFVTSLAADARGIAEVVVCGHSLGGAMSPAVATWLVDKRASWDPGERCRVSCYAFAGPTTGNAAFAEHATRQLRAGGHRIANSLDTSPMGWSEETLQQAKVVYSPAIPESQQVTRLLDYRILEARPMGYAHFQPDAVVLPGRISTALIDPLKSDYENYHAQSSYQHLEAYFELLELPHWVWYQTIIRAALGPLAEWAAMPRYYSALVRGETAQLIGAGSTTNSQ